eukprot:3308459-Rhodomonas_salina.1
MESVITVTGWSGGAPWRARNIAAASALKEDGGPPTWALDTSSPGLVVWFGPCRKTAAAPIPALPALPSQATM